MKLSNYIPKKKPLTDEQKKLIESYFWGEKSKEFKDIDGVILNTTKVISLVTGISENRISRYLNILLAQKRNSINDME